MVKTAKISRVIKMGVLKTRINELEDDLKILLSPTNKKDVLLRDGFKCRLCDGKELILEVHHLTPISRGGTKAWNNLITVCKSCHLFLHCNPNIISKEKRKHSTLTKNGLKNAFGVGKRGKDKKPRKREGYVKRWANG